jgi:dolichol-phosphate mannosyltransferase
MSLISLIYGLFLVIRHYAINIYVQGWTSLMVSLFFLSGLLLANMGLLGLYIGKIFDEAKNRPIYIISELINVHNKNSEKDTEK